jgi:hypothetical protein
MTGGWRSRWVETVFWIVAGLESLFFIAWFVHFAVTSAQSEFDNLIALALFAIACVLGVVMLTFALVRNRVVRGIALVLAIAPPLTIGARYVGGALTSPSAEALNAGHGYFTRPADRALADAVVAGDGRKVAELAPAANTNAIGFNGTRTAPPRSAGRSSCAIGRPSTCCWRMARASIMSRMTGKACATPCGRNSRATNKIGATRRRNFWRSRSACISAARVVSSRRPCRGGQTRRLP